MRVTVSFLAAILLPVCLLTGWYLYGQFETFNSDDPYIWIRTREFLLICTTVAAAHVVALGIPTYLLLRMLNAVRGCTAIGAGAILGGTPIAIISWPLRYPELHSSATFDGVQTIVNGSPTSAGWLQYIEGVAFAAAIGIVGALAFWLVLRAMSPNNRFE